MSVDLKLEENKKMKKLWFYGVKFSLLRKSKFLIIFLTHLIWCILDFCGACVSRNSWILILIFFQEYPITLGQIDPRNETFPEPESYWKFTTTIMSEFFFPCPQTWSEFWKNLRIVKKEGVASREKTPQSGSLVWRFKTRLLFSSSFSFSYSRTPIGSLRIVFSFFFLNTCLSLEFSLVFSFSSWFRLLVVAGGVDRAKYPCRRDNAQDVYK